MSIFLRCQWLCDPSERLSDRFEETSRAIGAASLISRIGTKWFQLGGSRKQALKTEVSIAALATDRALFRRVPLGEETVMWAISVWNGKTDGEDAILNISLFEPPQQPDGIGLEIEFDGLRAIASWGEVLNAARELATRLGGCSILSSHALREQAAKWELPGAEHAAFAAFWGDDRSGRNPLFNWMTSAGLQAPLALIACDSWDEASKPDKKRLREICEALAGVAASAGGLRT